MIFTDLIGKPCAFYGVDNNKFRLGVDGQRQTFEAMEDESDGCRSMLREVRACFEGEGGIFFATPLATVIPTDVDDTLTGGCFNGYTLVDARTGHVWVKLGTDTSLDDCYPTFVFDYTPSGEQHPPAAPASTIPPGTACA